MLTDRDYREILQELGFEALQPISSYFAGRALRHRVRRFVDVPRRQDSSDDAFWPTLYWISNGNYNYFSTPERDRVHFGAMFWIPASQESIHAEHRNEACFVPRHNSRLGLRVALESLFLAVPEWL